MNKHLIALLIFILMGCNSGTMDQNEKIPEKGSTSLPAVGTSETDYGLPEVPHSNLPLPGEQISTPGINDSDFRGKIKWNHVDKLLQKAQKQSDSKYVAVISVLDSSGMYKYTVQPLTFSPAEMRTASDKEQMFIYSSVNKKEQLTKVIAAYYSDGESGFWEMSAWVQPRSTTRVIPDSLLGISRGCEWKETLPPGLICNFDYRTESEGCVYYSAIRDYICENN